MKRRRFLSRLGQSAAAAAVAGTVVVQEAAKPEVNQGLLAQIKDSNQHEYHMLGGKEFNDELNRVFKELNEKY